jgi:hypothetical protein
MFGTLNTAVEINLVEATTDGTRRALELQLTLNVLWDIVDVCVRM